MPPKHTTLPGLYVVTDPAIGKGRSHAVQASFAAAGGAGINSAKAVIDTGAQAVLTGNCGPNAERTLSSGKIKLYTHVAGTVAEAVEQFKAGSLTEATGPSVDSHSGLGQ